MSPRNVLLMGYFKNHIVGSKVELLKSMGYNVHAFEAGNYDLAEYIYYADSFYNYGNYNRPVSHNNWIYRYKNEIEEIIRNLGLIKEYKNMATIAMSLIEKIEPDIIWGVWGSGILSWLRTFRRVGFRGKIVWTANVIPNRIKNLNWSSENMLYKKWLHKMGGIILTGNRMQEFMQKEYPRSKNNKHLLLLDYLPKSWFAKKVDYLANNKEPHVVYLGAPERYGKKLDIVDTQLLEMANAGIHIHCAKPKDSSVSHTLIHYYEPFDDASFVNGEFGQFINQFDAAIVLYNYERYHPRFASTFPTRFIVALCGCTPIFLKKGLLLSCEEFVEGNGIGKAYENTLELKKMLMDVALMDRLRKSSKQNYNKFSSDSFVNRSFLKDFLDNL